MVNLTLHISGGNDEASLFVFDAMLDIVSLFQTLLNPFGLPHSLFPQTNFAPQLCEWISVELLLCNHFAHHPQFENFLYLPIFIHLQWNNDSKLFSHTASRINLFTYYGCWAVSCNVCCLIPTVFPCDNWTNNLLPRVSNFQKVHQKNISSLRLLLFLLGLVKWPLTHLKSESYVGMWQNHVPVMVVRFCGLFSF